MNKILDQKRVFFSAFHETVWSHLNTGSTVNKSVWLDGERLFANMIFTKLDNVLRIVSVL